MYIAIILILLFLGVLLLVTDVVRIKAGLVDKKPQIIYRYIPRGFQEQELDPIFVSDIFDTMFAQPSPWNLSLKYYDQRKQEKVNQYFVNQL